MNTTDIYTNVGVGADMYLKAIGVVIVLLVLIIFYKFRKAGGGKTGALSDSRGLDLISLKKKGLLTPEELEKVGQAMLRQMELKDQAMRRKTSAKSAEELLLDPEVRRLEALAMARVKEPEVKTGSASPDSADQRSVSAASSASAPEPETMQTSALHATAPVVETEDMSQVELPLDVQQLADAGLLTPEEVQNVKRRLLERRRLNEH